MFALVIVAASTILFIIVGVISTYWLYSGYAAVKIPVEDAKLTWQILSNTKDYNLWWKEAQSLYRKNYNISILEQYKNHSLDIIFSKESENYDGVVWKFAIVCDSKSTYLTVKRTSRMIFLSRLFDIYFVNYFAMNGFKTDFSAAYQEYH